MTRLSVANEEQLKASEPILKLVAAAMGFCPNSMKVMARKPDLLNGFVSLSAAVVGPGVKLSPELLQLVAHVTSSAAGCRYCQAHTAHMAERRGAAAEKIEAVWEYETSPLFSDAERAALALAQAGGSVPNQATDGHFEDLKRHFSEDEIIEILAVIAFFGFLNRWNDTLATTLEDSPLGFAEAHLIKAGWERGNHD